MKKRFKDLTKTDLDLIKAAYSKADSHKGNYSREQAQNELADHFGVLPRSIRNWAKKLQVNSTETRPNKIMVYDIETSRNKAWVWWSGKQYIHSSQLIDEPRIITVAWKWLGDDKVNHLTWDNNHSDRTLMEKFLTEYNKADMIIGYNNDRFDNRWINARAMKYDLDVNTHVRSFDIMKEEKRVFRTVGYSMAYMASFANVTHKQGHEGIHMWNMIQTGSPSEQEEYLQKMVDYNVGDIVATEELYFRLRKYFGHKTHLGVLNGGERFSCPDTGSLNVELYRRTVTPAGTIQVIMINRDNNVKYRLTNKQYMNFLDYKLNNEL